MLIDWNHQQGREWSTHAKLIDVPVDSHPRSLLPKRTIIESLKIDENVGPVQMDFDELEDKQDVAFGDEEMAFFMKSWRNLLV